VDTEHSPLAGLSAHPQGRRKADRVSGVFCAHGGFSGFREANGISSSQTTPDGSNDSRASPWSWLTKLCSISRVPKLRWVGLRTTGPPLSAHLRRNCFRATSTLALISTRPVTFDNAPCLTACRAFCYPPLAHVFNSRLSSSKSSRVRTSP